MSMPFLNLRSLRWLRLRLGCVAVALLGAMAPAQAQAAVRIKEVASVQGVRPNQLVGYGLVVGLDGTGDQTTQTPFTTQSLNAMLQQLGVTIPQGTGMQLKNVASVLVTATLPAFAQHMLAADPDNGVNFRVLTFHDVRPDVRASFATSRSSERTPASRV